MNYIINVSLKGKHFFRTGEESVKDADHAQQVYNELRTRFPEGEGYKIDVTLWINSGTKLTGTFARVWSNSLGPIPALQNPSSSLS